MNKFPTDFSDTERMPTNHSFGFVGFVLFVVTVSIKIVLRVRVVEQVQADDPEDAVHNIKVQDAQNLQNEQCSRRGLAIVLPQHRRGPHNRQDRPDQREVNPRPQAATHPGDGQRPDQSINRPAQHDPADRTDVARLPVSRSVVTSTAARTILVVVVIPATSSFRRSVYVSPIPITWGIGLGFRFVLDPLRNKHGRTIGAFDVRLQVRFMDRNAGLATGARCNLDGFSDRLV